MSRPPFPPLPELWESAVSDWIGHLKLQGLSPQTRRLRRGHIRTIARRSGTAGPADITAEQLKAICVEQDWSAEYRKSMRASLVSFYGYCISAGLAADDPSVRLPRVKPAPPCPRPATDEIWENLLAAAPPRQRLMARLAGEAGLRRAEVAQVHRDDLMPRPSLIVHGKGGKQRVVPLNDSLAAEIRERCNELAESPDWNGYLFPGAVDGHLSPVYVGILISRLMPPGWSMHKARHRFATRAYRGSRNLLAVKALLGHASVATTQLYCAIEDEEVRAAAACAW